MFEENQLTEEEETEEQFTEPLAANFSGKKYLLSGRLGAWKLAYFWKIFH